MTYAPAPSLIQYAGDDQPARPRRGVDASTLFLLHNMDTHQIATYLGITEAEAHKRLTRERARRHGYADPYRKGDA